MGPNGIGVAIPLSGWPLGEAATVDGAQALCARAYQENRLEPCGRKLSCLVHRAPFGASFLLSTTFGGEGVEIGTPAETGFYTEHFVIRGRSCIRQGERSEDCVAGRGVVLSPLSRVRLTLDGDCVLMGVRVETDRLDEHFRLLTGRRPCTPVVFEPRVELARGPGERRHRLLRFAIEKLERVSRFGGSSLLGLEEAYLNSLLTGQPHTHLHLVEAQQPDAGALAVRRVEDYIHAHPEQLIRSDILVALSGVSTSALYDAFRRQLETTPMRLLRDVRLERVREDLVSAEPGETITAVALRWGFTHLARFSGLYRARFGELPSETLALARHAS